MFLSELPSLLERFSTKQHADTALLGDFNFHFDNVNNSDVKKLKNMFQDVCMTQHINVSTQRFGHTLDWAVLRENEGRFSYKEVYDYPGISDHYVVACELDRSARRFALPLRTVSSRNYV